MQGHVLLPQELRVLGDGFEPGARLAVVIGDDGIGLENTLVVDENGRFDRWLSTSGLQPGYHTVHVTHRASGATWSAGVLVVNPLRARVSTEVPWVGEPVMVEGRQSIEGHKITVTLRATDSTVSTTAAADGTFSVQLPTTGLVPGTYGFDVVDEVTGIRVAGRFVLTAGQPQDPDRRVSVVPGNPVAGDPLGVEGTGYEPGTALRIGVSGTDVWVGTSAGPDGVFSVTLPTGALASREYVAAVEDGTGRRLAWTTIYVLSAEEPAGPSVTVRPGNPGSGEPITVSGTGFTPHREVTLLVEGLHDSAAATVAVGADGTFSVELPTGHLYPGAGYHVTVTDTASGRGILLVPFSISAYLTVAVRNPELQVGDHVLIEGKGVPQGVTVTIRGTGMSYEVEMDEYSLELPTSGLEPGEYTVVAVSGSGDYAETMFTLAAAEDVGPGGTPGMPDDRPPESPAPTPEAPQRPAEPRAYPEPVVADGPPLQPAQPGSSAPAAAAPSAPAAPAAHGGAVAAAAPVGLAGALPRTGAGIASVAVIALSLLLAGAGALGLARRKGMDR